MLERKGQSLHWLSFPENQVAVYKTAVIQSLTMSMVFCASCHHLEHQIYPCDTQCYYVGSHLSPAVASLTSQDLCNLKYSKNCLRHEKGLEVPFKGLFNSPFAQKLTEVKYHLGTLLPKTFLSNERLSFYDLRDTGHS